MLAYLASGTVLGLSAGLAPGPLLALLLAETLRQGTRAGVKVALAPLLTDLPIIAVTLFGLTRVADFKPVLGVISLAGACFILFLGIENMKIRPVLPANGDDSSRSLQKGILVNFLSPHPYLFWITVGGPIVIRAMPQQGAPGVFLFVGSFYLFLVGAKILLAMAAGRSRSFLQGAWYILVMRILALALIILAGILARDGLRLLGAA